MTAARWIRQAAFLGDERGIIYGIVSGDNNITAGDFMYLSIVDGAVEPFSDLSDGGTKAQNQAGARDVFVGVALRSYTTGNAITTIPIATRGIFEFDCSSASFNIGDLVGPAGTGAASAVGLSNSIVEAVAFASLAIGKVARRGVSITRVQVEIASAVMAKPTDDLVAADTISEVNSGVGVTIDGTLIKDGGLAALSPTTGIGYGTGAGGAVTQITTSATTVVLNKVCGQITTVALTTAGAAEEAFTVTNSTVDANDVVVLSTTYAGAGAPLVYCKAVAAGSFDIGITNLSASALNALMLINFTVIKSVVA